MQLINRAFITRPFIAAEDSYEEVKQTLARVPFMRAIQTHYIPATDTEGAFIVATCKDMEACIQIPYAYVHSREGAHYAAAAQLMRRERPADWHEQTLMGSMESRSGFLFCFGGWGND